MTIASGTRLGPYEIKESIGRGAMGIVYRGYHDALARTVAVKVLQAYTPDSESPARFRQEAQAIAQLKHPSILQVFDYGEHDGTPYMVVEYLPGGSLADVYRGGPLSREQFAQVFKPLAAALDYAHTQGIIHRDVKPANVLIQSDGTPVLADFGLVKLLQNSGFSTMTGMATGTPAYMAPEQAVGKGVGPAADIYALAAMAYQGLAGVPPFTADGLVELLYAHVHNEPVPLGNIRPDLGPAVSVAVARGLAKSPVDRWGSCVEMIDAVVRGLAAAPMPVATPAAAQVDVAPQNRSASPATTVMESSRNRDPQPQGEVSAVEELVSSHRKGRRWLLAIAASALVLLLALGIVYQIRQGQNGLPAGAALQVSPASPLPGEEIVITGQNLPPNQLISVQFATRRIATQTDASGNFQVAETLAARFPLGSYAVRVCWRASCPLATRMTVV
ncbi:MAG TPA: serine/threonine-protein kinase [Candidatus Dormibacteraeota bacterium]|jgi:serine/threonine-protein kinase|nr:serine/threonine-protein kinase [Candidatus Dormibacteraeota bacterium]